MLAGSRGDSDGEYGGARRASERGVERMKREERERARLVTRNTRHGNSGTIL